MAQPENNLYNNILINNHSFRGSIAIDAASANDFVSDYNILVNRFSDDDGNSNMTLTQWQLLGYDLHSMIADPEEQIFVDYLNNNFHLLQSAQAVDAGTNLVLPTVFEDLDNISRPQGSAFDIGCYEFSNATSIEKENIPESIHLFQNYSNPFNPTTKIRFRIADFEFVNLIIYDILGNEVAILVNEEKQPAEYLVEFDVTKLSSGIYFYQLQAGSFAQTKSMVLIK